MEILNFIIIAIICLFSGQVIIGIIGTILYLIGIKKTGHYLIATCIAGDFGLCKKTRKWIHDKCPRKKTEKCKIWTCEHYSKCSASKKNN